VANKFLKHLYVHDFMLHLLVLCIFSKYIQKQNVKNKRLSLVFTYVQCDRNMSIQKDKNEKVYNVLNNVMQFSHAKHVFSITAIVV